MKVLVILHIFYHDQLEYFIHKLSSIHNCDWDLVVTWPNPDKESEAGIRKFKKDASFIEVGNFGYDIWPFIKYVKTADLSGYDFVIKLHTKGPIFEPVHFNGIDLNGYEWRNVMVDSLLKSKEQFGKVLDIFRSKPEVGIVYSAVTDLSATFAHEDHDLLEAEMLRTGIRSEVRRFCPGTIFAIRPAAMKSIISAACTEDMFMDKPESHSKGTFSHIYERMIPIGVMADGYRIATLASDRKTARHLTLRKIARKPLRWLFCIDLEGYPPKKVMTLLGLKFTLKQEADI